MEIKPSRSFRNHGIIYLRGSLPQGHSGASNSETMRYEKTHPVLRGTTGQITGFAKNAYDKLRQGSFVVDPIDIDENSLRPPRGALRGGGVHRNRGYGGLNPHHKSIPPTPSRPIQPGIPGLYRRSMAGARPAASRTSRSGAARQDRPATRRSRRAPGG